MRTVGRKKLDEGLEGLQEKKKKEDRSSLYSKVYRDIQFAQNKLTGTDWYGLTMT